MYHNNICIAAVIHKFLEHEVNTIKIYYDYVYVMEDVHYTPEIVWREEVLYLIRVNNEEQAIVDSEHDAKIAVDSIAAFEMGRLESERTKVYRQDSADGKTVAISKQSLGKFYNGSISTKIKVDYTPVKRIRVIKSRLESKKPFVSPQDQEKFLKAGSTSIILQNNDYTSEDSSD